MPPIDQKPTGSSSGARFLVCAESEFKGRGVAILSHAQMAASRDKELPSISAGHEDDPFRWSLVWDLVREDCPVSGIDFADKVFSGDDQEDV